MRPICIDANVFIASTKENEPYCSDCKRVIRALAEGKFYLVEPAICMSEVVLNIVKYIGMDAGKRMEHTLRQMVSVWETCDERFCTNAAYTGALYKTYAADALYLETALKHGAILVTLDDADFLSRIKGHVNVETYHPKDFP